jgi:hypothetical protein
MTGRWTAAIARRVLREETYRLTMEPAMADAGFECTAARRLGTRHRLALILTLILAALHDIRQDVRATYCGDALRTVWVPAVGWATLYGLATFSLSGPRLSGSGLSGLALMLMAAAFVVPVILAPAVLGLVRREARSGSILAATIAMTAASVITTLALRRVLSLEFDAAFDPQYLFESARTLTGVPLLGLVGLSLSYSAGWRVGARLAVIIGGFYLAKALLLTIGGRGVPVDFVALLLVASASLCVRSTPGSREQFA